MRPRAGLAIRLGSVGAVALAIRLAVVAATPGYRPIHDDASYVRVARTLLALGRYPGHHLPGGGWQESAYRPPGWPGLLWASWRLTGETILSARVGEAAVGAVGAVLVAVVAGQLFGAGASAAAGLLAAASPLALAVGSSLESETLFTALVLGAAAAALAARRDGNVRWALAAGALAGLAALTRTTGLLAVPVIALLSAGPDLRRRALRLGAVVVVAAVVVAPWTMRNALVLHAFVPVSSETGNTLAGTYNDVSRRRDGRWLEPRRTGAYRAIYRRYGAGVRADPALRRAVARWVLRHPTYPFVVAARNTARLAGLTGVHWAAFSLATMSLGDGAAMAVWLGVIALWALAVAGMWLDRRRVPAPVWLLLAALFMPAVLVNGELRLGAPAQALALTFAGVAAVRLAESAGRRQSPAPTIARR